MCLPLSPFLYLFTSLMEGLPCARRSPRRWRYKSEQNLVPESLPSSAVRQTVSKETKNCPLVMNALLRIEIGWSLDLDWVVGKGRGNL